MSKKPTVAASGTTTATTKQAQRTPSVYRTESNNSKIVTELAVEQIEAYEAFLSLLLDNARSLMTNLFLAEVRRGENKPARIVRSVAEALHQRCRQAHAGDERRKALLMLEAITQHENVAIAFADYCLAYEALPAHIRKQMRAYNDAG
jgi:hypothetical protein